MARSEKAKWWKENRREANRKEKHLLLNFFFFFSITIEFPFLFLFTFFSKIPELIDEEKSVK